MAPALIPIAVELAKLLIVHGPAFARELGEILQRDNPTAADIEALKTKYAPDYDSFGIKPPPQS
jgi:hypothetical protein